MLTHRTASSSSLRTAIAIIGLASTSALLAACPDPDAEFDSFAERYEEINKPTTAAVTTGGGACDYEALEGEYLFALGAVLKTKPIMFRTTFTVDGSTFSMVFQPLKAMDKTTPVGDPINLGPFDFSSMDGAFTATLGTLNIPGAANSISGTDIVANDVILTGGLCSGTEGFICGTVTGQVVSPTMINLAGSTFGMLEIVDGALPEKTTIDCAGTMGMY